MLLRVPLLRLPRLHWRYPKIGLCAPKPLKAAASFCTPARLRSLHNPIRPLGRRPPTHTHPDNTRAAQADSPGWQQQKEARRNFSSTKAHAELRPTGCHGADSQESVPGAAAWVQAGSGGGASPLQRLVEGGPVSPAPPVSASTAKTRPDAHLQLFLQPDLRGRGKASGGWG